MQIHSPNYSPDEIPVEFIVVHYTATTLAKTLEIFQNPERKVSSHLVIDRDGTTYEVVPCLSEPACKAWHAGKSRLELLEDGKYKQYEGFNSFSVGIELVNVNGNVFPFSEAQYLSLGVVKEELIARYPRLALPGRIVGHSEIAGFRGKCDPGRLFEWNRVIAGPLLGEKAGSCSIAVAEVLREGYQTLGVSLCPETGDFVVPEGAQVALEKISSALEAALSGQRLDEVRVQELRGHIHDILRTAG